MGIRAMFLSRASGITKAAAKPFHHNDSLTQEFAKVRSENSSAARNLEDIVTELLDTNNKLRLGKSV